MWCKKCQHGHKPDENGKCPCNNCGYQLIPEEIVREGSDAMAMYIEKEENKVAAPPEAKPVRYGNIATIEDKGSVLPSETLVESSALPTNAGNEGVENGNENAREDSPKPTVKRAGRRRYKNPNLDKPGTETA